VKILVVTKSGSRAPTKKTVQADWLRVGRSASCEVHLPDPRVPLQQGMIVDREGLVYLEGEVGSQNITRKSVKQVRLVPGQPMDLGPYRIEAQAAPEGYDGAIRVELVRPLETSSDFASRTDKRTLASVGLTRRRLAWLAAFAVLAIFLALPAGRVLDLPWRDVAPKAGFGDKFWNPGPLLLAHQPIEQKCAACHEVAFEQVKDRACLQCHSAIGHHVGPELQPAAMFEGARCATCHRDHKGVKTTHRDDDSFCSGCHADIKSRAKDARSANVADFARDHPEFRLSLPTGSGIRRVRQGEAPIVEQSNLVFPHALHLDPKGVRSPVQGRMTLECKSCHQPDATRRTFEPVSMPKHCQECHTLQFEPAVTTREVPHGKPAQAITAIEEFYAHIALQGVRDSFQKAFGVPGEGLLRRPGEPDASQRQAALRLATRKAQQVAGEMFEVRVCKTCHAVSKEGDEWKVAPVRANHHWMPQARFDHRTHEHAKCADCHDVKSSKKSSDVAMPTVESCRECHGGSRPVEGKVMSNCMLCHGFHDGRFQWDPHFKPGARVAQGTGLGR
jgi:hypothetical protein